jgi:membrane protein implicated in regulation of membrane protease activity
VSVRRTPPCTPGTAKSRRTQGCSRSARPKEESPGDRAFWFPARRTVRLVGPRTGPQEIDTTTSASTSRITSSALFLGVAADPPSLWCGLSGTRRSVPSLLVGLALVFLLPHPWNGVGLAAAIIWEIVAILYSLRWSKRQPPLVGTDTLLGRGAVVVEPCAPWGRVRLQGETWRARSEVAAAPGARVRIRSVEGLSLHVEPEQAR